MQLLHLITKDLFSRIADINTKMSSGRTVLLNTGHKFPTLGYGTWLCSPEVVSEAVFEALKVGYRHLDLAKVYGNQVGVGDGIKRALAEIPGLKREDLFITSKLWNNSHRPEDVEPTLDDTLAELGLDYLDVSIFKNRRSINQNRSWLGAFNEILSNLSWFS